MLFFGIYHGWTVLKHAARFNNCPVHVASDHIMSILEYQLYTCQTIIFLPTYIAWPDGTQQNITQMRIPFDAKDHFTAGFRRRKG